MDGDAVFFGDEVFLITIALAEAPETELWMLDASNKSAVVEKIKQHCSAGEIRTYCTIQNLGTRFVEKPVDWSAISGFYPVAIDVASEDFLREHYFLKHLPGLTSHYTHRAEFPTSEAADACESALATTWNSTSPIIAVTDTDQLDSSGMQPVMLEVVHEHDWANHANCKREFHEIVKRHGGRYLASGT